MKKTIINIHVVASLDVEVNIVLGNAPAVTVYPAAQEATQEQQSEESTTKCDVPSYDVPSYKEPGAPSKG